MPENSPQGKTVTAPGPKGHPFFGVLGEYARDPLQFLEKTVDGYGDIARFKFE